MPCVYTVGPCVVVKLVIEARWRMGSTRHRRILGWIHLPKHQPASAASQTRDPTDSGRCHGDGERLLTQGTLEALLLPTEMVVITFLEKKKIKKEKTSLKPVQRGWWKWSHGIFF